MIEALMFFAELTALGASSAESNRDSQDARYELERLSRRVRGSAHDPWFGRLRVDGDFGGRELRLEYRGSGEVELSLSAPKVEDFEISAPWAVQRWFGEGAPSLSGWTERSAYEGACSLLRRFQGSYVWAKGGRIHARATPGLSAGAMLDLVESLAEIADAAEGQRKRISLG